MKFMFIFLLMVFMRTPFPSTALADDLDAAEPKDKPQYTQAQINEMINNPLGELWILFFQNDLTWYDGDALDFLDESDKIFNTTTIMPVMAFQLTENWKYILRPVITLNSWDVPRVSDGPPSHLPGAVDVDWERQFALGDSVFWNAFATNEMAAPPNIYGFGVTTMFPTATKDTFGTGKWSAGPMALAVHVGPPGGFIFGVVAQQWWSFAGQSNRDSVSMSNIQYLGYYRYNDDINIGFGPNIVVDWTAESGQKWTIPVGMGFNKTVKIGPLPVKMGLEAYYYVEKPDKFGPDFGFRFIFAPVVPKPGFSKIPIF